MLIVIQNFLLISAWIILLSAALIAQTSLNPNIERYRFGIPDTPKNCEITSADIYALRDLFKTDSNPKSVFTLIARLGEGETRLNLNHRRLYNVSKRMGISKEKVVTAEGKRINGFGRVEVYWGGKMVGAVLAGKNRDVCVDCCGPDERYYPDKEEFDRKQKGKRN